MCNIIAERDTTPDVRSLGKEELRAIVDYLRLSHINYTDHYFPTLHSHIHTMAAGLSEKQQQTINSFYDIYEASVMNHFHHEEQVVFPYINSLVEGEKVENYSIGEFAKTHSDIDERMGGSQKGIFDMEKPLMVTGPFGDKVFDLSIYSARDLIKEINDAYIRGTFEFI
jgi:iron-sulfur cluster repair protein YtfE (RIC family)